MLAPVELLGPIANYIFIRHIGGDKKMGASHDEHYAKDNPTMKADFEVWRQQKNSFWPDLEATKNKWTWIVIGCGAAGVALEQAFRTLH
jgi:hypothetical protein